MEWKECIQEGIITKMSPNSKLADDMLIMAKLREEFWEKGR